MPKRRRRGSGSIYQRSKDRRWVALISRGSGPDRKVLAAYRRTRAEAEEALAELQRRHGPMKATSLTVGDYLERWVRDTRDLRPRTRTMYESVIRVNLLPDLGMIRLADLSPLHVEGLLSRLSKRLAPKTVSNVLHVLQGALAAAQRAELIDRNPAARAYVKPPKVTLSEPDTLSIAELDALRRVLPGSPIALHVSLALGTGLRQGEQLGLAWEDIDLDKGLLHVRRELARIEGKYQRVEPKTPRSRRTVPLAPALVDGLREHRKSLIAAGFTPVATGPVFVRDDGTPVAGRWLLGQWWALLAQAGIKRRPWKILRATFASRMFEMGVADRAIADLLGHRPESRVTHRNYISTGPAAESVTEALGRLVG